MNEFWFFNSLKVVKAVGFQLCLTQKGFGDLVDCVFLRFAVVKVCTTVSTNNCKQNFTHKYIDMEMSLHLIDKWVAGEQNLSENLGLK